MHPGGSWEASPLFIGSKSDDNIKSTVFRWPVRAGDLPGRCTLAKRQPTYNPTRERRLVSRRINETGVLGFETWSKRVLCNFMHFLRGMYQVRGAQGHGGLGFT